MSDCTLVLTFFAVSYKKDTSDGDGVPQNAHNELMTPTAGDFAVGDQHTGTHRKVGFLFSGAFPFSSAGSRVPQEGLS
jgi:hypothetical protein